MLKIWGRMSSINVKKVVWAAQELGLAFERLEAGGQFGVVKTPEYMRMNPNSLVPVIDDDGFVLWESNVVTRYLCAKHSTGNLYPTGLQERFNAERWMDWQQTTVNPAGRDAFIQLIRTPLDQRNQNAIDQSVTAMQPKLAMLEAHFSTSIYAVGNTFTMADIPLALEIQRWWGLPLDAVRHASPRETYPHVNRWYTAMLARPASRGVLDLALA
jgi:glutathione S-transferase